MPTLALQLEGITKTFGGFTALDQVDLHVRQGSVHAILGENGAGKTTLMNILYGLYQPDSGRIRLHGVETTTSSPRRAMECGIGMIHQHFMLVDSLTVVENVVLGLSGQGLKLSLDRHAARLAELSAAYGFDVDPWAEIAKLPLGMRQRVEILKVLYRDASIVILDEPTSVLAPSEIASFLEGLKSLRDAGKTVIFITHKLDEVSRVGDRFTIMRRGRVTAEGEVAATDAREMARLMVGREVNLGAVAAPEAIHGEVVVAVRDLRARDARGAVALKGVSFEIRAGEILGVAGVDGNGQAELAETLAGLRPAAGGAAAIGGEDVTKLSVYERRHRIGLSFVPEDRHGTGLVLDETVVGNAILRDFAGPPFSRYGFLLKAKARRIVGDWVRRYDVRLRSLDQHVRYLSGGNQQKLIFAREVESGPRVLVAMQPCKGLDVGATEAVHRTIREERARGVAILYISTELDHLLEVCDRIAVMCAGTITGVVTPQEATTERVGALMGGLGKQAAASCSN